MRLYTNPLLLALLASSVATTAAATPYRLAHTFQRANPAAGDLFGTAVVLEGGVAAIKSDSGNVDGDSVSVTHVFEQGVDGGWTEAATLEFDFGATPGPDVGNFFIGQELAIDNGEIVIGYGLGPMSPSLEPIQFATRDASGWSVAFNSAAQWRVNPRANPYPFARDGLRTSGRNVDISGRFAIADAPGGRRRDGEFSVARIYEKNPEGVWIESANLFPAGDDMFGIFSVALDGTTAAVIDRGFIPGSSFSGLLFFERSAAGEWVETESFRPTGDNIFPRQVEIDGDTAVTYDPFHAIVTVYERLAGVWTETANLGPGNEPAVASFTGFAVDGDLIAQTVETGDEENPFRIDLYQRSGPGQWGLLTSIADPEPLVDNDFGASLALDQGRLLVGTTSASRNFAVQRRSTVPPGVAYLFVPVPEPSTAMIAGAAVGLLGALRRRG